MLVHKNDDDISYMRNKILIFPYNKYKSNNKSYFGIKVSKIYKTFIININLILDMIDVSNLTLFLLTYIE